jgi:hypothetical protein
MEYLDGQVKQYSSVAESGSLRSTPYANMALLSIPYSLFPVFPCCVMKKKIIRDQLKSCPGARAPVVRIPPIQRAQWHLLIRVETLVSPRPQDVYYIE